MSDHCMPSLLTQPYAIAIHTTTNQTLVLLVVQGGGSSWPGVTKTTGWDVSEVLLKGELKRFFFIGSKFLSAPN